MITMAQYAMGTRFELVLHGADEVYLRAAGEEAFREIVRLERQLSLYRDDSDISELNRIAAYEPVRVDPRLFRLLQRAIALSEATEGAFDITIAPLMRVWGFIGGTGRLPEPAEIEAAKNLVGTRHIFLNEADYTVAFDREGVTLDLGAIGKGYAIDQAIEILRDAEITSALLHGGTSSVYAIGTPPDGDGWRIAIQKPFDTAPDSHLALIELKDAALSVSAPTQKGFVADGTRYGHVLDPRSGKPNAENLLAALVTSAATEGDALSTALLIAGNAVLPQIEQIAPEAQALLAVAGNADAINLILRGDAWIETPHV